MLGGGWWEGEMVETRERDVGGSEARRWGEAGGREGGGGGWVRRGGGVVGGGRVGEVERGRGWGGGLGGVCVCQCVYSISVSVGVYGGGYREKSTTRGIICELGTTPTCSHGKIQ